MQFKASSSGSLMLLGEYAVLYGKRALSCAIDKRMTVTLTPRNDERIEIHSSLGSHATDLSHLEIKRPFHFVLGTLKTYQTKLKQGCDIHIESEFSDQVGLGSSAAVTVATLAALINWLKIKNFSAIDLTRDARTIIRRIQGVGSGADVAASVYGGIVSYCASPLQCEKFLNFYPLTALYAGFKTPTVQVIKQVQEKFVLHPNLFRHIYSSIGECADEATQYLRKQNWAKVGEIMNIQQGLMESLGVSMPLLQNMVYGLREQQTILGAKISGSGMGDCVIGLGEVEPHFSHEASAKIIPLQMTNLGVQCEKI